MTLVSNGTAHLTPTDDFKKTVFFLLKLVPLGNQVVDGGISLYKSNVAYKWQGSWGDFEHQFATTHKIMDPSTEH